MSNETEMTNKPFPTPPDPEGMNEDRAEWAEQALETFASATRMNLAVEPHEVIGDLLANIMHWCDRHQIDFDGRLENARMHYAEETDGYGKAGLPWCTPTA